MKNTIAILALLFSFHTITAQSTGEEKPKDSFFDLLLQEEVETIELSADFTTMISLRKEEEYYDGFFTFEDSQGKERVWDARVRLRGKFRRMACVFPPLRVDLDKDQLEDAGLKRHDDLKIVTHCLEGKDGRENIFREYLVYQMYQEISEVSFRA
ncbi:MAG: hypothetical protein R3350_07375, partial [Saprospiraceae bacterium]|nr:hypothetical protein [Saprospiraceae bacterium]